MTEPTEWIDPAAVRAKLRVSRQRLQQLRRSKALSTVRYDSERNTWMYSAAEVETYLAWRQTYHPLTNYVPPHQQPAPKHKHAPIVSPEEVAALDQWRADAQEYLESIPTGLEGLDDGDDGQPDPKDSGAKDTASSPAAATDRVNVDGPRQADRR